MKRRRVWSAAVLLILAACGSIPAPATEAPTTPPTTIPATSTIAPPMEPTAQPTDTPEPVSPFLTFSSANCCKARTVEAGDYELPSWMEIPLTMEVGEGWGVLNEEAARLFLLSGAGRNEFNDPSQVLVFIAIPDGDPQDVLGSIKTAPQLTPSGEITETTFARFSGWTFDAVAKPNPENEGSQEDGIPPGSQILPAIGRYFTPGFLWTTWTAEPWMRFLALDTGEHVLLLVIESPPADFETFVSKAEGLLESLKLSR